MSHQQNEQIEKIKRDLAVAEENATKAETRGNRNTAHHMTAARLEKELKRLSKPSQKVKENKHGTFRK